jgi:molybdopterin-guanine dinucleotide biosynthesis protein A
VTVHPCSAIIVAEAGDPGQCPMPAFETIEGQRVLDRLMTTLAPFSDEIIIVARDPAAYLEWDALIVSPHRGGNSVLEAVHAGLFAARHPHALATWCRMPRLQPELIETLCRVAEPRWDAVIGTPGQTMAPLPGIYSKRCLTPMAHLIAKARCDMGRLLEQVHLRSIEAEDLRTSDSQLQSYAITE